MQQTLSSDERERADNFFFTADRKRHVIGRAVSKILLGHGLGIAATEVSFAYNANGKPSLATKLRQSFLHFNVAHSGDFVLVALAYGRDLGIDIEQICTNVDIQNFAAEFFSQRECMSLAALPPGLRLDAFFSCWTRKEAYLKARGDGLSVALDKFDVPFLPEEQPRLVETRHDPTEACRWTLQDLDAGPNYKAALAVEGASLPLKTWDWLGAPRLRD